jgi:ABC-type transporter Mla subunit MlaD
MRKPLMPPSPLRDAAQALDQELERYGALAAELGREPATTEKSLRRSARLLQGLGETEHLLGQHLGRLVAAIEARREQQEATVAKVQHLAEHVRERSQLFGELLGRCDTLAKKAAAANAVLQQGAATETEAEASLLAFEQTAGGLEALAAEAQAIGEAARAGNFPDVARQTDGLHAQLTSAHRKILAVCERFRQGRVVH